MWGGIPNVQGLSIVLLGASYFRGGFILASTIARKPGLSSVVIPTGRIIQCSSCVLYDEVVAILTMSWHEPALVISVEQVQKCCLTKHTHLLLFAGKP